MVPGITEAPGGGSHGRFRGFGVGFWPG